MASHCRGLPIYEILNLTPAKLDPIAPVEIGWKVGSPPAKLPDLSDRVNIKVWQENDRVYVVFPAKPSEETRAGIKRIYSWKWHPERPDKAWSVPAKPDAVAALLALIPNSTVVEDVTRLAAKASATAASNAEPSAAVMIDREGKGLRVSFPVADGRRERVAKIKDLGDAHWYPDESGMPWRLPDRLARYLIGLYPEASITEAYRRPVRRARRPAPPREPRCPG